MRVRRNLRLAILGLLALAASAWLPQSACAHVFAESETPPANTTLNAPPSELIIRFNSPVEPIFAKVNVLDSAGNSVNAGNPELSKDRRVLTVRLKPLRPGSYTVKWRAVATDSHRSEGSYNFTVAGSS